MEEESQILSFPCKPHRRSVSFSFDLQNHGSMRYLCPSELLEDGHLNFSPLSEHDMDDLSERSRDPCSHSYGSDGSRSFLFMSFESFADLPTTEYDDPQITLRPRVRMSRILGDEHVPDVFNQLVEQATRHTPQTTKKTLWSWDPMYNMPAIIFIKETVIVKTVSKLVLSNNGFVVCQGMPQACQ